jgi:hypothetical protein
VEKLCEATKEEKIKKKVNKVINKYKSLLRFNSDLNRLSITTSERAAPAPKVRINNLGILMGSINQGNTITVTSTPVITGVLSLIDNLLTPQWY